MRITAFLAVLFSAALASAQVYPPDASGGGGAAYDGGTVTNPFLAPTGCASPGYSFTDETDMGVCRGSAGLVNMTADTIGDGTANGYFQATGSAATMWFEDGLGNNTYITMNNGTGAGSWAFFDELGRTMSADAGIFNLGSHVANFANGTQAVRALQGREVTSGIHFPASLQATFGTYVASGSYQAEVRASSSGSVASLGLHAADGGNAFNITLLSDRASFAGGELLAPNGSISGPAWAFTAQPDMGMWLTGTVLSFETDTGIQFDTDSTSGSFDFAYSNTDYLQIWPNTSSTTVITSNVNTLHIYEQNGTNDLILGTGGTNDRIYMTGSPVDLTDSSAVAIVQVSVGTISGFTVNWSVHCFDSTDWQMRRGSTYGAVVNKSATETCALQDIGTSAFAESAGASTLAVTTGCDTSPTNAVNFTINPVSSLTCTTLQARYTVLQDGLSEMTPQ